MTFEIVRDFQSAKWAMNIWQRWIMGDEKVSFDWFFLPSTMAPRRTNTLMSHLGSSDSYRSSRHSHFTQSLRCFAPSTQELTIGGEFHSIISSQREREENSIWVKLIGLTASVAKYCPTDHLRVASTRSNWLIPMAQQNPKGGGAMPMDNNELFLKRALEKLLGEKEMKKTAHQALKRGCEAALGKCLPGTNARHSLLPFSAILNKDPSAPTE